MEHCTLLELHPREKLPKLKLIPYIGESAKRILDEYFDGDENIPETTNKVYAMGKAIANYHRKNKPSNGNKSGKKLKTEMKRLRQ